MMACQSSSATPFYVAPNFENEDGSREAPSEPLVDSIGEMFDLPVFRLSSPSPDQLAILGYLQAQNGATKRTHSTRPRRGTQVYNRYLFENRRRALQTTRKHNIIKLLREQSYIHVEKTVAKRVSTSMITDEMRSGYSPTQRSNDLIAGLSGSRPGSVVLQGRSTWSPSQPNIIYERAEL